MIPNIDERGRRARARWGRILLLSAAVWAIWSPRPWTAGTWTVVGGLSLMGAFMLFEARKSWCALRACGIKTSL